MTKRIKTLLFLLTVAITTLQAQTSATLVSSVSNNDPVVSMLDSLVTISNVIKYQEQSVYNDQPSGTEIPVFSAEVYEERISKMTTPIPLTYNDQVRGYIDLYANKKRNLTSRVMGLSSLYFPMYEEVLEREGIPLEFKYLSIVESALNPTAVSRCGATGLWQFMYNTGIMYDLDVNSYVDDRKDPYKSTVAACEYFKNMYKIYNDWLLVIASYNCGPGNVNRAIIRSGGKTDFWSISPYLPAETRGYVPAFIAVTYLMNHTAEHNLTAVAPSITYFETDTVQIYNRVSFSTLSKILNLPVDVIAFLNPTYKKGIIPQSVNDQTNTLRLPSNKITAFVSMQTAVEYEEVLLATQKPDFSKIMKKSKYNPEEYVMVMKEVKKAHIVSKGQTLSAIAKKYNCTVAEVKSLNHLKSNTVKSGQRIYVMNQQMVAVKKTKTITPASDLATNDSAIKDASPHLVDYINGSAADKADELALKEMHPTRSDIPETFIKKSSTVENNKAAYHLVQKGDTLYGIARSQGITIQELIKYNGFSANKKLQVGEKIKVSSNS